MKNYSGVKYFLLLCFWIFYGVAQAQQDPLYTQYVFNTAAINPAYVGSHNLLNAGLLYRKQWAGITASPTTATLGIDAPLWQNRLGAGLLVGLDKIGKTQSFELSTQYAYRIPTANNGNLALGLQAGFTQYSFRGSDLIYNSSQLNGNNTNSDPTLEENITRTLFNVGTGIWFNNEHFFAGFSVPRIITHRFSQNTQGLLQSQARQYRHYFLMAGYVFELNENFQLKPSALLRAVEAAPLNFDVTLQSWYKQRFGAGLSYRHQANLSVLFEFNTLKGLRISYAYDFPTTALNRHTLGSHEIMLRYQKPLKNTPTEQKKKKQDTPEDDEEEEIIISPRLF
ncbi:PorP/SprF family type IX secretion system membrane protein [Raineya orbicola]|jgi:type IX secretion system PorP/SprF family membrane protein|uniref:Bacteroidetes-specific putative membrane protein n=1 Tax=Raineya orbicola TaxID=2016530 RepID=A0A2N3IG35_9BACT|nr:type IX secretion system membrane protein PorP/SprF [Raineya orbicola]PKQ69265.1 Bacteroidetes-specific putative membrane protein [Raineya orbicola]